ncbi:MAG: hypothetical protein PHW60_03515 [Kiritimatiellae bacterium]|nr:hypothetical protein [Kiritimatiellia bacterium]
MIATLRLSKQERIKLEKIKAALKMIRRRLRRSVDTAGARQLFDQFRATIHLYEDVATRTHNCTISSAYPDIQALRKLAIEAYIGLGSQAEPKLLTLKDYDHQRFGPFLGVSDEGSAAGEICRAALADPKCISFKTRAPLVIGLALDAERLGATGEVAVGPAEYQKIRLDAAQRILTTTNVGTRVNVRHYLNRRVVAVPPDTPRKAVAQAIRGINQAIQPFLDAPGERVRPLPVLLSFVGHPSVAWCERILRTILSRTNTLGRNSVILQVGLQQRVSGGRDGTCEVKRLIDLASACGVHDVAVEAAQRPDAERVVSQPGLLNYFSPTLLQDILKYASKRNVSLTPWKTVDTETTARNIWMGLSTARHMGLELGKYGLAPLTYEEQEAVIQRIQGWFGSWCAAPVHYIDLPQVDATTVYSVKNTVEGTNCWLDLVGRYGVPVVLIDTAQKSKGTRLMKRSPADAKGIFRLDEIQELTHRAQRLGVRVLWAGGLNAAQAHQLGGLGVFGLYVTSDAAERMAVTPDYDDDPMLPALKEPTFDKVLHVKILIEAGFLGAKLREVGLQSEAAKIRRLSCNLLTAKDVRVCNQARTFHVLRRLLVKSWRHYERCRVISSHRERRSSPCA